MLPGNSWDVVEALAAWHVPSRAQKADQLVTPVGDRSAGIFIKRAFGRIDAQPFAVEQHADIALPQTLDEQSQVIGAVRARWQRQRADGGGRLSQQQTNQRNVIGGKSLRRCLGEQVCADLSQPKIPVGRSANSRLRSNCPASCTIGNTASRNPFSSIGLSFVPATSRACLSLSSSKR